MSIIIDVIEQPPAVIDVLQSTATVVEVLTPGGVAAVLSPLVYNPATQTLSFDQSLLTGLPPSAVTGAAVVNADPRLTNARTPTAHKATHATGGSDALTPADIGAEPLGAAASSMSSHLAAADPHPQYTTAAEAAAAAPVQSVAGKTGAVTLTPADVGADATGTAAAAVTAHEAAADPHTQYTTAARVRAVVLTGLSTAVNAAVTAADSILSALGKLQAQLTAHVGTGGAAHADATTSTAGFMAAADKTKLDGIAAGATANSSDAQLRDRSTHTGTQAINTVTGLQTALDGKEAVGTATNSMATHLAAADPHSQYTTAAEAAAAAPVQSVAGKTGTVTLAAADITDSTAAGRAVLTAADAAAQRTALGLVLGTDVQAYDADLQAIAALAGSSGLLRKTGANTWSLDTSSFLTGNQTVTVTGDASGSGATSIALTLANSGVAAGTYNDSATQVRPFTVDAKGRVTAVGAAVTITPAWASITGKPTTLSGYGITDAQPLDADLTAIAALAGTAGLLRKTAADTWTLDTAAYLTGNQSITLSGDATGSGATAISVTLANTGVSAGTYRSVTVDAKGRVTAGTNPTTLTGFGITDAQPLDSDLTAIAALTHAADGFLVSDGTAWTRKTPADALVSLGLGTPTGTGNVVRATSPTLSSPTISGVLSLAAGTALLPSLAATGDLDTGVFFPSANTWAVATGGSGRVWVTSAGWVGVGTSSPAALLHVFGNLRVGANTAATQYSNLTVIGTHGIQADTPLLNLVSTNGATRFGYLFHTGAGGNLYLLNQEAGALQLGTNNSERMRIDSSGNVGIGTTNPAVRLDVAEADNPQIRAVATTNGVDTRLLSLGLSANAGIVGTYSNHPLVVYANSQERMRIDSSGNVGIGTTSPVDRLAVVGSSSGGSIIARVTNSASAVNSAAVISFDPNGNGSNVRDAQIRGINVNGVTQTALAFLTANGATPVEYMRITHDGNVGIGTQTPAVKLEVAGQIRTEAPTGGTAANWRLGTVHTVSPTSPDRTIEVDIGGTIYYLHAKTTNN